MSNTRKLRASLTGKKTVYSCAVCRKKFRTAADRYAHWKFTKEARMCAGTQVMVQLLGFRYSGKTWYRPRSQEY